MMTDTSLEETLLPALLQCFGIIFLGYIIGKCKILCKNEARGLSIFVQYLALPTLIFSTVSTMPFSKVRWEFVASIFIAKTCVFVCVTLISILLTHPVNLGKAGMYAIAATQSNDFALGYPLLVSLYQNSHPEFTMYLYIIAPVQLLLLNGIGFFFLEINKHNKSGIQWTTCHIFYILKNIFKNPVIIMTLAGLLWNVTYGPRALPMLDSIFKAFSSAFPATALLLLGYTMNLNSKNTSNISLPVVLIVVAKNLILPIILQKISTIMLQNHSTELIKSYSSFGFLYGTIPTAPTAYVFAVQYESCVEIIAKSVLSSTLLAAPLMFSTASVISLAREGLNNVAFYLSQTISYISLISLLCSIWLLFLFYLGKRWRNISFGIIIHLVLAQCFTAIGGLMLFCKLEKHTILFYVQYVLTSGSIFSTRLCTMLLAILLLVIRVRSVCYILQVKQKINILTILIGLILPYIITLTLISEKIKNSLVPMYPLGYIQIITTFIVSIITLFSTVLCLILQQVFSRESRFSRDISSTLHPDESYQNSDVICDYNLKNRACSSHGYDEIETKCCDIEDIGKSFHQMNNSNLEISEIEEHVCDLNYPCSDAKRIECSVQVSKYITENQEIGTGINDDKNFLTHIGLIIALCVAMTLSLSVCLWKLYMEAINGIFIELEFLDAIVNYSLGIFFFIMFGFDQNLIKIIYTKWTSIIKLFIRDDYENIEKSKTSEYFLKNLREKCKMDLAENKLINSVEYKNVIQVHDLTQWLLAENLVHNTDEADEYVNCLLMDNILEKVYENNNFLKNLQLLKFTKICNLSDENVHALT